MLKNLVCYGIIILTGTQALFESKAFALLNGQPISKVLAMRHSSGRTRDFTFLELPKHMVGNCTEGNGNGKIVIQMTLFARSNHALIGEQDVSIDPKGMVTPTADDFRGGTLLTTLVDEPFIVRLARQYDCNVPILTAEQRLSVVGGASITSLAPWEYDLVPGDLYKIGNTDQVLSNRYKTYISGSFQFGEGESFNVYHLGSQTSSIIAHPGIYGLDAVYYHLPGYCGTDVKNTLAEATTELEKNCSESEMFRQADLASQGVGITVVEQSGI